MNEIKITFRDGIADVEYISEGCGGEVRFVFDGTRDGVLTVAGISSAVNGGEVTVDLSSLSDGEYAPVLITPEKTYTLPTIVKERSRITFSLCNAQAILAITKRVRAIEDNVSEILESIKGLSEKINGTTLF